MLIRQALTLPVPILAFTLAWAGVGEAGWSNGSYLQGPGYNGALANGTKSSGAGQRADGSSEFDFNDVSVRSIKLKPKAKTAAPEA